MKLPLYLISSDPGFEAQFVVRTSPPRFIAELVEPHDAEFTFENGEGLAVRQWIDDPQSAEVMASLLGEIYKDIETLAHVHGK